jgi:hypothetical protein
MKNKKPMKAVISMCTSNAFLLVLTTSPIATIADVPEAYSVELAQDKKLLLQKNDISEKVAISKDGPNVYFTIIGNKGVYCAIAYKAPKFMSDYRLFPNTITIIRGLANFRDEKRLTLPHILALPLSDAKR